MRHDSKSVSLVTQHHMYLSFLAINFCLSSRTMTAVPCTGIFTTLNLSRVAWWRDESSIVLSETKPAWEINPQVPWWLTALSTVWWINTARGQEEAELANCSLLSFWNCDTFCLPNSMKIDCSYKVNCCFPTHRLCILQYLSTETGNFLLFQDLSLK